MSEFSDIVKKYSTIPLSKQDEIVFKAIVNAAKDFGDYLGVDLSSRMPSVDSLFVFAHKQFKTMMGQLVNEGIIGFGVTSCGFNLPYKRQIFSAAAENTITDSTWVGINHELVHLLSYHEYTTEGRIPIHTTKSGFIDYKENMFIGLTEAMTDITSFFIIKNFWPKYKELEFASKIALADRKVGYYDVLVILDLLLDKLAVKSCASRANVSNILQKSFVQNPYDGIDFLRKNLEPKELMFLANLPSMGAKTQRQFDKAVFALNLDNKHGQFKTTSEWGVIFLKNLTNDICK